MNYDIEIELMKARAELVAIQVKCEGMVAENQHQVQLGQTPTYRQADFQSLANTAEEVRAQLWRLQNA